MATSTIVSFKSSLDTTLSARAGLSGVLITRGIEPVDMSVPELLVIGDVTRSEQTAAALGRQRREENYTVEIEVTVVGHHADDQDTLSERAMTIASEVEDALRDDCSVGGVVRVAQVAEIGLQEASDGNQRWARVPMRIRVDQRI